MHFFVVYSIVTIAPIMASVAVVFEGDVAVQEPSLKAITSTGNPSLNNGFVKA